VGGEPRGGVLGGRRPPPPPPDAHFMVISGSLDAQARGDCG